MLYGDFRSDMMVMYADYWFSDMNALDAARNEDDSGQERICRLPEAVPSNCPMCGLTLSWAEKCARARRSARERTQAGQWVRGAARARAERS